MSTRSSPLVTSSRKSFSRRAGVAAMVTVVVAMEVDVMEVKAMEVKAMEVVTGPDAVALMVGLGNLLR